MTDTKPLFEVGEVVLLRSKTHPQFDGEYPVLGVYELQRNEAGRPFVRKDNFLLYYNTLSDKWVYDLGNFLDSKHMTLNDESELRKKHSANSPTVARLKLGA